MLCAFLAFKCNRRINAIQLANGLTLLAGGVSVRVNQFLHAFGITVSRDMVLDSMDSLRIMQEERMKAVFQRPHIIQPILVYDNIDMHIKVHNTRMEAQSQLFHGTWGFFKEIPRSLTDGVDPTQVNLQAFRAAMAAAENKPVNPSDFVPTPREIEHWKAVIFAQLAKAMYDYREHLPGVNEKTRLAVISKKPPPIDPIEMHQPNIHFLRMMDAPDNSAAGVSQVLDAAIQQTGQQPLPCSSKLLVAAGDVGSNELMETLRGRRYPSQTSQQAIDWILTIFGAAHTTWNMDKSIWYLHYGKVNDAQNHGGWQSLEHLGGNTRKPLASQDFNGMMRQTHQVHYASLVHLLMYV